MVQKIITYGDERLRKVSKDVDVKADVTQIVADLWETLEDSKNGVGLAAPQIGINKRIFVINDNNGFVQAFVNPKLISAFGDNLSMAEGCLSIPGLSHNVIRLENVTIEFYDENWNFFRKTYTGFESRIIQHEYDHLEGVLWIDHIFQPEMIALLPTLAKIKNS